MATLQKAQIIKARGDIIWVKHPDISNNVRTNLTANVAAAGVTLTVLSNSGFTNGDYLIIGVPGNPRTEVVATNGAITAGTSITVANTLAFAHYIDDPVTYIKERQIRIKSAATLTGTQTAVTGSPFTITWDKSYTACAPSGSTNTYYFAEFYDAVSVYGTQSDGVLATGLVYNTAQEIIQNALRITNEKINDDGLITRENMLEEVNNWQDDVVTRRDWSWELLTDQTLTSTEMENEYALSGLTYSLKHPNSAQSIVSAKFSNNILTYFDWHDFEKEMEGRIKTTLASDVSIGATTATLTDSYEFAESGTISVGTDTVTYTANAQATGVLSGVPASGDSSFEAIHSSGANVWQGVTGGTPVKFTIYNDKFYADIPVSSAKAGIKFKLNYYKAISRLTDYTDTTDIPFVHLGQYYLAARIEWAKGRLTEGDHWLQLYEAKIATEVKKDRQPQQKRWIPQGDDTQPTGKFYKSTESSVYNNS